MTPADLNNSPVILVTGGGQRIGSAIVRVAHRAGFRVVVHYHQSTKAARQLVERLNQKRPNSAKSVQANLSIVYDFAALQAFKSAILSAFGRLDVLVHNASRFYPTPFFLPNPNLQNPDCSIMQVQQLEDQFARLQQGWQELFLTNAQAPLFLSWVFWEALATQQGCIVSLLDIHANGRPFVHYPVYNMAKAAHQMMVQSLALELAPAVRVNGVAPGVNIFPEASSDQAIDPQKQQAILDSVPLNRAGTPEEIAEAVLYFCHAKYVTGQILAIDGGRSLTLK